MRTSVSDRLTCGCPSWIVDASIVSTDAGTLNARSACRVAVTVIGSMTSGGVASDCANAGGTGPSATEIASNGIQRGITVSAFSRTLRLAGMALTRVTRGG